MTTPVVVTWSPLQLMVSIGLAIIFISVFALVGITNEIKKRCYSCGKKLTGEYKIATSQLNDAVSFGHPYCCNDRTCRRIALAEMEANLRPYTVWKKYQ